MDPLVVKSLFSSTTDVQKKSHDIRRRRRSRRRYLPLRFAIVISLCVCLRLQASKQLASDSETMSNFQITITM